MMAVGEQKGHVEIDKRNLRKNCSPSLKTHVSDGSELIFGSNVIFPRTSHSLVYECLESIC